MPRWTIETTETMLLETTPECWNMTCIVWGFCIFVGCLSATIWFIIEGIYPGIGGFIAPATYGLITCVWYMRKEHLRRREMRLLEETRNIRTDQITSCSETSRLIAPAGSAPTTTRSTPRQTTRCEPDSSPPSYVEANHP